MTRAITRALLRESESRRAGDLRSDRVRLQGRRNDPLLLRSRPTSASLHRCDHFNQRLGHRSSPRIIPRTCRNASAAQGGPHRPHRVLTLGLAGSYPLQFAGRAMIASPRAVPRQFVSASGDNQILPTEGHIRHWASRYHRLADRRARARHRSRGLIRCSL
jgi:hypothetical protein